MPESGVTLSANNASGMPEATQAREFEPLVAELSADFVSMPANAIDDGIERWLGRIVRALGLERSTVVQLEDDAALFVRSHSYTVPGHVPLNESIMNESAVPWLARQIRNRRLVIVASVRDLPPEAFRERELMLAEGLKSAVIFPLVVGGEIVGFVSFTSMSAEREWRQDIVKRLQLVADIVAGALRRKRDEVHLDQLRRFEQMLSTISRAFIQVPATAVDAALTQSLRRIVEFLGVDRGTILTMSIDGSLMHPTHWHANPGIEPMPSALGTDYSWTFDKLSNGEPVVVSRISELPDAAAKEREYFVRAGVRSIVAIPLKLGDRLLGAAIFSSTQKERRWQNSLVQRLRLLGEVFANALSRRDLEDGHKDLLRFEKLVSSLSARFAGLPGVRVDDEIRCALHEVLEFFDADQCGIFEAIPETRQVYLRFLAHRPGVVPVPADIDYAPLFPWEYERLCIRGETVIMKRLDDLPPEASIDRNSKAAIGIRSTVDIPIAVGGTVRFLFSLGFNSERRNWPHDYIPRLRLLGDTLVSALSRARAEEALRTSEERFRCVVESAPNGVMMTDSDGRIVMANRQMERIFGYDRGELIGTRVEMLLPLHLRERHHADRREYTTDPEVRPMGAGRDLYGLRRNGTEVPIEVGLNPVATSEGRFMLATVVDVTERKNSEEALRASARSLAEAQRIAKLGSWRWDMASNTMHASEEARRIVGAEAPALPGLLELVHPADRLEIVETMERLVRDRKDSIDLEFRIVRSDGVQRVIRVRGHAFFAADGDLVRTVGTIQDMTDLRQAEHEMRTLRAQLWHFDRIARTGTLTASLAHELNQPLAAILSNAQAGIRFLARDNPDLGELREILGDIVRDDKRAAGVISSLRAMVRQQPTERKTVDMAGVLNEILGILHSELVGAVIEVHTDFQPGCSVLADRVQLQQVVLNLIMNAVEAMRESGTDQRELSLACRRSGEAVQVRVKDSGPGIPLEQLDSVFDAFQTTKSQGMGLGLAVCRSIVESHGGRIGVENNDGGPGMTFIFDLAAVAFRDADSAAADPGTGDGFARWPMR